MLTLLGKATSINVRKVLWTCDELGLECQLQEYGSGHASTQTPEFLALNPNGTIPVLRNGDSVLWESNAICRYLATRYPRNGLMPEAIAERALVEQWMDWQIGELNPAWRYAFMALVRRSPSHPQQSRIDASTGEWNRLMSILDGQLLKTGAYVTGSAFTLADIVLGLSLYRWRMTPIEHAKLPALEAYFQRLSLRPAFLTHGCNGIP